jgi:signal transduction histidine kinase
VIRFSVRDDGVGFDPESVQGPAHGHFGLQGIRERLDAISGNLEIESSTGTGTKVMVSFPAEKEEA